MILPCSKKTEFLLQIVDYDVDDADDDENDDEDEEKKFVLILNYGGIGSNIV